MRLMLLVTVVALIGGCDQDEPASSTTATSALATDLSPANHAKFNRATEGFLTSVSSFLADVNGCVQSARFGDAAGVPKCIRDAEDAVIANAEKATASLRELQQETDGECGDALSEAADVPASVIGSLQELSDAARQLDVEGVNSLAPRIGSDVVRTAAPFKTAATACVRQT